MERRVPGLCTGACFAHLQLATADNAGLRQEIAHLQAQMQRADEAVDASQTALEALRVTSRATSSSPPVSAETCKLFVSGLSVGSQRTFASEFTKFCRDCLGIQLASVNVSVVGVDTHGLSRAVVKLQTVAEAKRILEAGKRFLTPRCNIRMEWNRSRAVRAARSAERRCTGGAHQGGAEDSSTSLALAALFVPAARSHDVTACTSALASASDSAAAALAALLAQE